MADDAAVYLIARMYVMSGDLTVFISNVHGTAVDDADIVAVLKFFLSKGPAFKDVDVSFSQVMEV